MTRRDEAGFTLVEILMAMAVFLAGIGGILALLTTGVALQREGLDAAQTARVLDDVAAELQLRVARGEFFDEDERVWRAVEAGYDPALGRWLAADEVGRVPGAVAVYAELVPEPDDPREGTLLARVGIGRTARAAAAARAVPFVLQPRPSQVQLLRTSRARRPEDADR